MQVHYNIHHLPRFRNAVVTIGTFDGVHPGHRQIFQQMKTEAADVHGETVIVTFHPHPRRVVKGKSGEVFLLTTIDERIELLRSIGIDHLVIVPFTTGFSEMSAEDYIENFLIKNFQPHSIIIGYDHRFGKNRSGDYRLLEQLAPRWNCEVKEIPEKILNEVTVSSTIIRDSLLSGDIGLANKMLGYPYFFHARVIHGDKRGRTIGYPTANLEITDPEKLIPGDGVYAVTIDVSITGKSITHKGMMNIGVRPTVDGTRRMIEVNIFNFHDDIYGEIVKVSVYHFIRREKKFSGLDELKAQLFADMRESLAYFGVR
ncbi:bifunctional riboflavin kinase/FAD synthetase [Pollutibacter soli]|uniref:bifunctional riboflavin kinase/FAD synthetase n=1 Tax=Pollutibacter soli TaxID=3034157 RepID=UPI0030138C21